MLGIRLSLIISVAALCLGGPIARADMLTFDIASTQMEYTLSDKSATIQDTSLSVLRASLYRGGAEIGSADIMSANDFDLLANLSLTDVGGSWSATGSVTLTDTTSAERVNASFTSSSNGIKLTSLGLIYYLTIDGNLQPSGPGNDILVPSGASWTFVGDSHTITIDDPTGWDSGTFTTFQWAIGNISDLDTFFQSDRTLAGGETIFTVVPMPAGVVLGFLGLAVAGLKLRKLV